MKSLSCFKPKDPFKLWSKEMDKKAASWAKDFDTSFKLLLLGPAGAGKTTILKQIKIIHNEGFSIEERRQKAKEIRTNLLESVRELTACITESGREIDWADAENRTRLDFINNLSLDDQTYELYASKIYDYSKRILNDKGVRDIFEQLNQLSITHRSQYLLNRVEEIRSSSYLPNNDDILHSRRRTSDIQKLEFNVNFPAKSGQAQYNQTFCMFDVGGQRGERRKWIQVFDGVSAVMFLIDSSSFDSIDEESGRNKLREALKLFSEVWTTRFLLSSNFILLFNKQDILREKIERGIQVCDFFPEFSDYQKKHADKALLLRASEKLNLFRTSKRNPRSNSRASVAAAAIVAANSTSAVATAMSSSTSSRFSSLTANLGSSTTTNPRSSTARASTTASNGKAKSASLYESFMHPSTVRKLTKNAAKYAANSGKSATLSHTDNINKVTADSSSFENKFDCENKYLTNKQQQYNNNNKLTTTNAESTCINSNSNKQATATSSPPPSTSSPTSSRDGSREKLAPDASAKSTIERPEEAYLRARSFIKDKFMQITRTNDTNSRDLAKAPSAKSMYNSKCNIDQPKRTVCYHYTTATETDNIREMFASLQKMMVKSKKERRAYF